MELHEIAVSEVWRLKRWPMRKRKLAPKIWAVLNKVPKLDSRLQHWIPMPK